MYEILTRSIDSLSCSAQTIRLGIKVCASDMVCVPLEAPAFMSRTSSPGLRLTATMGKIMARSMPW